MNALNAKHIECKFLSIIYKVQILRESFSFVIALVDFWEPENQFHVPIIMTEEKLKKKILVCVAVCVRLPLYNLAF